MRINNPAFATALCITALLARPSAGQAQTESCVRPPAKEMARGTTIVLSDTSGFPCTIRFVNTAVVLRADSAGQVPEVGSRVTRGPDGRFYTSMNSTGRVTVWNPDGSFRANFGRLGQQPGEFARGSKTILIDQRGGFIVGNNNRLWSMFSPTYEFVSTTSASITGIGGSDSAVLLDDGTLLATVNGEAAAFHIFDLAPPTPRQVRAFGPAMLRNATTRRLSYRRGDAFWAAPPDGAGLGYVLEMWRTDGTLLRTIRRDVPWMPAKSVSGGAARVPSPEMEIMHEDGSGLIFVTMMVPRAVSTLSAPDGRSGDPIGRASVAIDIYFEVIDANAGVVLASIGPIPPSEARETMPIGFLRGSRQGYRQETDAKGVHLRIVELQLSAR